MRSKRERLYAWDKKSMQWYENAVNYRSFHTDAVKMILADLPEAPSVCDIGCGIGALALPLAEKCSRVLAMDLNPIPIAALERRAAARGFSNITAVTADFETADPPSKRFDAAVFCLAGGVPTFLEKGFLWADKLFFIENATKNRSFSSVGSQTKEVYYHEDLEYLTEMGCSFTHRFFTAPFGQVFVDRADAEAFMHHYDKGETEEDIQRFLDEHLQPVSEPGYSLFLPNEKPLLFIEITR